MKTRALSHLELFLMKSLLLVADQRLCYMRGSSSSSKIFRPAAHRNACKIAAVVIKKTERFI